MKRHIILFAIFITAIFFYPVLAHSAQFKHDLTVNSLPAPVVLFVIGSGLLITAGLTKKWADRLFKS